MLYCNSTFDISSIVGKGTKVVITIPQEDVIL